VRRWIDRWNAYWFPETSTLYLAISRIVMVGSLLFWLRQPLHKHINLLEKNHEFLNPQLLISAIEAVVPRELFFSPQAFTVFYWIVSVAGLAALVGLFTRISLFVFALGTWILVAHYYSYGDRHHPEAVFAIVLMALAFAPSGNRLSLDAVLRRRTRPAAGLPERAETAMWPLKLAHVLLAMTYFSTGMSKLIAGGPQWLNGYTLQAYTFGDAINRNVPLGIWVGQQHGLAVALSVFTIVLETFFFVSLFLPRLAPFIFISAFFFQVGLLLTGGHGFYYHMVLLVLLLFFITPGWWQSLWARYVDRSSAEVSSMDAGRSVRAG
jgi:hypothetical protein